MLPESAKQVSELRAQFYTSFADALGTAVTITREKSYASTLPRVSWSDDQGRLNYLCMYGHSAPDVLLPDRPLVLRVGVNLGAELFMGAGAGRGTRRYNRTCQFYLTLVGAELPDALPWILKALAQPHGLNLEALSDLPYIIESKASAGQADSLWTRSAMQRMQQPRATATVSAEYATLLG